MKSPARGPHKTPFQILGDDTENARPQLAKGADVNKASLRPYSNSPTPFEQALMAKNQKSTANLESASTTRHSIQPLLTSRLDNHAGTLDLAAPSTKEYAPKSFNPNHQSTAEVSQDLLSYFSRMTMQQQPSALHRQSPDAQSYRVASVDSNASPPQSGSPDPTGDLEVDRLRKELQTAKDEIARMDRQLSQTRVSSQNSQQATRTSSPNDVQIRQMAEHIIRGLHEARPSATQNSDAGNSYASEGAAARAFLDSNSLWPHGNGGVALPASSRVPSTVSMGHLANTTNHESNGRLSVGAPPTAHPLHSRPEFSENVSFAWPDINVLTTDPTAARRSPYANSAGPSSTNGSSFSNWGLVPHMLATPNTFSPPLTPMPYHSVHANQTVPFQPRPVGGNLSPTALEFQAAHMSGTSTYNANPWSSQSAENSGATYMSHSEPLNYRRLLDKNVSCNWKYIVDKIVCSNDQQASIFLQQKLKIASPEQKFELIEAIIAQAYPLMINRFGNFLVQRCFEHGTPEQVVAIANAIRGNTLTLSMDPFGCHVVQKAFDAVPEDYKAIMVHELLRNIPETVIHRYACHVWQKLFELRWSDSPPQIMKYVNEALHGMWHEVALGETGSLVVQNIFENCLEEDKRPCIEEVISSIDIVSHGQFGNWCIQHICEHGAPADKSRAIAHVLRFATEYSTDQFASKVVEKCLKVGGLDFLERYLERVYEARPDRPRMPLIDIAGDQYGNYLIQYILTNAEPQQRETVAQHVRKHMVSLRGSKFGSRVAMLCSNPAFATRPGPAISNLAMHGRYYSGSSGGHNSQAPRPSMSPAPYR